MSRKVLVNKTRFHFFSSKRPVLKQIVKTLHLKLICTGIEKKLTVFESRNWYSEVKYSKFVVKIRMWVRSAHDRPSQ